MHVLNVTRWPTVFVFLLAGVVAACFAFVTVNLFAQAMANLTFLKSFGLEAVRHGALWQVLELTAWGSLALLCWLAFKVCEHELVDRYRTWSRQKSEARSTQRAKP